MPDTEMPAEGTVAAAFAAASLDFESNTSSDTPAVSDTPVTTEPAATGVADASAPVADGETFAIKVDGAERQVTRDELVRLAQMGDDYTRKTQALAADKQRLAAAEQLLTQLRDDPQGTLAQLSEYYQTDAVDIEDLDPEERRYVEMDRRIATFEEDARQRQIQATVDNLRSEFGDFDEMALVNHAIKIGTADLRLAYKDMTYETVMSDARAARERAAAEADSAAVTAKREAQVVSGGSASTNSVAPQPQGRRTISEIMREALAAGGAA